MFGLLTIRNKLTASFTLIVCLTVGVSLVAIFLFHISERATDTIIKMNMPAVVKANYLSVTAKGIAAAAPSLAISMNEAELKQANKKIQLLLRNIDDLVDNLSKQQLSVANHHRGNIYDYSKQFEPVLMEIYVSCLEIITLRNQVSDLLSESSNLSDMLSQALDPIKTGAGFNLTLTLMKLSNTDDKELDLWRNQAFHTDLPNFQSSMELGLSIQQINGILFQAANANKIADLNRYKDHFAQAVVDLKHNLKKFGSIGAVNKLIKQVDALIAIGNAKESVFRLRARQLRAEMLIEKQLLQAQELASGLVQVAHDFSGAIIDSARKRALRIKHYTKTGTYIALCMAFCSILLAVIIGWRVIGHSIIRRLSALRSNMIEGQKGNLNLVINTDGSDEISDMSQAFEFFVKKMREDIVTRMEDQGRIQEAMKLAEAANRAKSDFLANMSHEIRTPMNGVIGMTSLLLGTELNEEQQDYTETIRNSGNSLLSIINDILDYSKIEAGKLDFENIDFDLRVAMDEVSDIVAVKAHEKGLEFLNMVNPEVPSLLCGDPGRLRQILINLVSNATKFTEKGEVLVKAALEDENETNVIIRFSVNDTGIGIPHDRIDRLFKSFSQADSSTTRKYGGTGLGLTISKQLAELMGGQIGMESEEGKGSKFWFTAVLEKQPEGREKRIVIPEDIKGKRILIVDDNATNRYILRKQLKSWECIYEETSDGMNALEELHRAMESKDPYEVAILDMQMPEMDGETLGKKIKQDPDLKSTILILMTSMGKRGDAKRSKEIGFAAYLTKPVKQTKLYDCLATVTGMQKETKTERPVGIVTRHSLSEDQKLRVRILLAEDNIINQKVALSTLGKIGYSADVVANGQEVVKALGMIPYDIVLMDCQMPEMDGYEATREIRNWKLETGRKEDQISSFKFRASSIPIIAMTANAMKGDREKCLDAGMDDYLSKPVKLHELSDMLEKWVAK